MTEDEAFIRAVVDSPGDDTPRLVYADWLDDRGDPRGPYLRAEHEWAKPWRSGVRPADSPEVRHLSAGLDPVWAARVSRPPVGVCFDHFRLVRRLDYPDLTGADLERLQASAGLRLPADYAAFLLNHNGGTARPPRGTAPPPPARPVRVSEFEVVGLDRSDSDVEPQGRPPATDNGLTELLAGDEPGWLVVADHDIQLVVAGEGHGTVHLHRRLVRYSDHLFFDDPDAERRQWDSFAAFLADVLPNHPDYFTDDQA